MRKIPFALIVVLTVAACGDGSQTDVAYTTVTGTDHDCAKAPNASIDVGGVALRLTGTCERIRIKGNNNRIAIEAAKRIDVDGAKNDVEISAADVIRVNGAGNTVKFKKKAVANKSQDVGAAGDNNNLVQLSD